MKLLLSVIVIFFYVNCYAQNISKEEELSVYNQVKTIKSYVEPWNTTGIILVKTDSTKPVKMHCFASIKNAEEPILVVDGAVKDLKYLKDINPQNIQSVEIIKDHRASALYGTMTKHGVILITMKCKEQSTPVF